MSNPDNGPGHWVPPFSSPQGGRRTTAAPLPHPEPAVYLASPPPVTEQTRHRRYYGTGKQHREAGPEPGAAPGGPEPEL